MQPDFKSAGPTVRREVGQSETAPDFSRFCFSSSCFEKGNLRRNNRSSLCTYSLLAAREDLYQIDNCGNLGHSELFSALLFKL